MDILGSTKFQGHFHMDQMSYRCFGQDHISRIFWHGPNVFWVFWREPNFKDVLGWNKCFMNALDRIKYQWPFGQDQMSFKYRVWYYPQIQASDGDLGTYPLQIRGWGLLVLCFWSILVTLLVTSLHKYSVLAYSICCFPNRLHSLASVPLWMLFSNMECHLFSPCPA